MNWVTNLKALLKMKLLLSWRWGTYHKKVMYTQLQGKFRTVKAICTSMLCLDHIHYLSLNNPSFFSLKKHNPHMWGTNYQHPLHSTPFKNKSSVTYYPFTVNSSWSIYKPLAAVLEQEEYGNIDSFWEPILASWFPLVKPFGHKQAAGTML